MRSPCYEESFLLHSACIIWYTVIICLQNNSSKQRQQHQHRLLRFSFLFPSFMSGLKLEPFSSNISLFFLFIFCLFICFVLEKEAEVLTDATQFLRPELNDWLPFELFLVLFVVGMLHNVTQCYGVSHKAAKSYTKHFQFPRSATQFTQGLLHFSGKISLTEITTEKG